jgi:transcriptional regulator with XRE-family HTH domain
MFSSRLRQLRENSGWTQKDLAKKLNLTQSTIAYYESDRKKPTLENAIIIAKTFSISLDYLLGINNTQSVTVMEEEKPYAVADKFSEDINSLSPRGQKDLKDYIELLKLRDFHDNCNINI